MSAKNPNNWKLIVGTHEVKWETRSIIFKDLPDGRIEATPFINAAETKEECREVFSLPLEDVPLMLGSTKQVKKETASLRLEKPNLDFNDMVFKEAMIGDAGFDVAANEADSCTAYKVLGSWVNLKIDSE